MLQFSEFFAFSQGVLSKVEAVLSLRGTGGGEVQGDILALMNIEYSLKRKSSSSNEVISQTCQKIFFPITNFILTLMYLKYSPFPIRKTCAPVIGNENFLLVIYWDGISPD